MRARLLLAEAGTSRRRLDAVPATGLATSPAHRTPDGVRPADTLYDPGGDPQALPDQRWGLIAPEGPPGDALIEALAPLIAMRAEQQRADVAITRVPARLTEAGAHAWRGDAFIGRGGSEFDADLPRYRLVVGELDQISPAVPRVLATDGFVGRLAFDHLDDYAAYARKASRLASRAPAQRAPTQLVAADGEAAGDDFEALLRPLGTWLAARGVAPGEVAVDRVMTPDALLDRSRIDGQVLLTLGHGVGAPAGGWPAAEPMYRTQGALDFGRGAHLDARALASAPFVPGGLWLLVACFGGGTPAASRYRPWLDDLVAAHHIERSALDGVLGSLPGSVDGRPFVSAGCKAALANPDGPVAVVAHLDLAWSYAFHALDGRVRGQPEVLGEVVRLAGQGHRLGVALSSLRTALGRVEYALAEGLYPDAKTDRAHLGMLREDLRGYVLLGDPAARVTGRAPISPAAATRPPG